MEFCKEFFIIPESKHPEHKIIQTFTSIHVRAHLILHTSSPFLQIAFFAKTQLRQAALFRATWLAHVNLISSPFLQIGSLILANQKATMS